MRTRTIIKWILLLLLILIIAVAGYYTYSIYHFANEIHKQPDTSRFKAIEEKNVKKGFTYDAPKWEGTERVNILLLGGDSRNSTKDDPPRSDSMIVASIDPVTKKAYLFSILRDTYVKIPNNGSDRINSALAYGGPPLAMETVGNLLGIPIQYYVYTDFLGFIALINAIGGIDYEVEKNMKYSDSGDKHLFDIDLHKGTQHLNGNQALQYVRFRHDAMSDFSRSDRQRNFLKAVGAKLQSTWTLIKLPSILNSINPFIETNLSVGELIRLASLGYESKAEGIISKQLPPDGLLKETKIRGAAVITADPARLQTFVKSTLVGIATGTGMADGVGTSTGSGSGAGAGSGSGK